jgi:hypothetical protein
MIICGIELRAASGASRPLLGFYTRSACDLGLKLFTKSVDKAVENALKNAAHGSLHSPQAILVKKPSKKNFSSAYQRTTPSYDYAATGTDDNRFDAVG